jgi:hypothetical protein
MSDNCPDCGSFFNGGIYIHGHSEYTCMRCRKVYAEYGKTLVYINDWAPPTFAEMQSFFKESDERIMKKDREKYTLSHPVMARIKTFFNSWSGYEC